MSIDAHILKPLDFFVDFKQHELELCAAALKSRTVEAGEVLIEQGTPALTFFIILSGTYEVAFEGDRSNILIRWVRLLAGLLLSIHSTISEPLKPKRAEMSWKYRAVVFFELIQGDNALWEKIMKKIDKIVSERRAIAAGSQPTRQED